MVSLDIKSDAKTTTSSTLISSTPDGESTLSFSELLKGVSTKTDEKTVQNGSLILSLSADEKTITQDNKSSKNVDTLLGLLNSKDVDITEDIDVENINLDTEELNPKLVENLSTKDLKVLVADAKDYLKNQIQSSDEYKLSEVKDMPKTLQGLADMAKKLDIDVSKISMQEVQTKQPLDKLAKLDSIPTKNITKDESSSKVEKKDSNIQQILQTKEVPKDTPKQVDLKESKIKPTNTKVKLESKEEPEVQVAQVKEEKVVQKVPKQEIKTPLKTQKKLEPTEKEKLSTNTDIDDVDMLKEQKTEDKYSKVVKELKTTPLFKAQETTQTTTTQQMVQVKSTNSIDTQVKTAKDKADETLKLLLRGEKPATKESGFTADFSVATAKVIAPDAITESKKSVDTLLHGEATETSKDIDSSVDGLSTHKADSFEVKLNEAKQMVKYLSSDVKTAIEDYKSPFTRVKVQLNPQQLGEVDLTIVQRGKNLHVNISSNNAAINTLALNANDLKVQLANNGINNASLNFSNTGQDNQNTQQQQQSRQQHDQAKQEYNYFEQEEANEEILSSLEIIVPQYG